MLSRVSCVFQGCIVRSAFHIDFITLLFTLSSPSLAIVFIFASHYRWAVPGDNWRTNHIQRIELLWVAHIDMSAVYMPCWRVSALSDSGRRVKQKMKA